MHQPVDHLRRIDRHLAGQEHCRLPCLAKPAPVAAAIRIDSESQLWLLELDVPDFDIAIGERDHRQPDADALDLHERCVKPASYVGDPDLFEAHIGHRQQPQRNIAANPHFAAEHPAELLLKRRAIAVPVDKHRHGKHRRERDDQQSSEPMQQRVHLAPG